MKRPFRSHADGIAVNEPNSRQPFGCSVKGAQNA